MNLAIPTELDHRKIVPRPTLRPAAASFVPERQPARYYGATNTSAIAGLPRWDVPYTVRTHSHVNSETLYSDL
jgi:hypothetical protein